MGDYRQHGYLGKGLLPTLKKYTTDIDVHYRRYNAQT